MSAFSIAAAVKQLALLGVACGTTGTVVYRNPDVVRKAIHRITPAKSVPKHAIIHKAGHINTKTVPACVVGVLPMSGVTDLVQPNIPMDWDDGYAPQQSGSETSTTRRGFEISRPPFPGSTGGFPAVSGGGGGSVGVTPTPKPEPTPVAALPEPSTWFFMLAGVLLIGAVLRRNRTKELAHG